MDDFLFGGRPETDSYCRTLDLALQLCHEVGFPDMSEKVVGPSMVTDFPGFHHRYRSYRNQATTREVPDEADEQAWRCQRSCIWLELLSLIGNLQHASSVVKPDHTFLRRMINLSKRRVHLDGHLRLNTEFCADLQWWALFLDSSG